MRKVLITGSTSGFGKLLVDAFLKNGDYVIATGRNLSQRQELFAAERKTDAHRFLEIDLDVIKPEQVKAAVETVRQKVGRVDILINNAGYGLFGALEEVTEEQIRYQMEVNFFGTVSVTRAFLPLLRESKGKLFNFASVFGFMGFPLTSLYCASKFAVEGLTESLRGELAPHGVQVCLIEPGGYRTSFGQNLLWAKNDPNSIYALQMDNYHRIHEKISKAKPQEPHEVSDGVLKLSKKNRLPMRKVFGRDGNFSYWLRTLTPNCLYYRILDMIFKHLFLRRNT